MRSRQALTALSVDVGCVLLFCALGRRSHAEGVTAAGVAQTAWPFVTGTGVGWLVSGGWRRPMAITQTGVVVWLCTVTFGMVLRKASAQGVAASFIVVASLVTAILLLGWRAAAALVAGRRR